MDTYLFNLFQREKIKQEKANFKLISELFQAKNVLQNQILANQKLVEGIVGSLINALEAKDPYTQGHSRRVSMMAAETAKSMGLPPRKCEQVRLCALFHDIGKIGIQDSILLKKEPLTDKEFDEIKQHPVYSVKILKPIDPFNKMLRGVLYHHENWDGSGYPEGLEREAIPLSASIIHVVDSYDAMTSKRSYRAPLSASSALAELQRFSQVHYHPEVVRYFCSNIKNILNVVYADAQ